jgi:hypothetical protein
MQNMEREGGYSSRSKSKFVHEIKKGLEDHSDISCMQGALECFLAYDLTKQSSEFPTSFLEFLRAEEPHIHETYTQNAEKIIVLATYLHETLSTENTPHESLANKLLAPVLRAKDTIGMWKDLGHIKKDVDGGVVDSIITVMHEDPKAAKNILESLVARLTVGELVTKPLIGLVAITAASHGLPEWMSTESGIRLLLASTALLAVLKTEQDINNKQNDRPFLTVETNILSTILGFELRKSAYFVRMAWLLSLCLQDRCLHIFIEGLISALYY